jgi:iron complex outermembrane receptor protein
MTTENTGDSYNIRSMAENIDRSFKTDTQWFKDFSAAFLASTQAGITTNQALKDARVKADAGRPQPHTAEFDALIKKLGDINNWDVGAALRVKSWMYHAEGQYNLKEEALASWKEKYGINVLLGFDYRMYQVYPDGNYFINPVEPGKDLTYYKYGAFTQITKSLFDNKLQVNLSIRADKNQYFDWQWNPRVAMVFSPTDDQNFCVSFQNGYRFPSLFEAFSNVNSGGSSEWVVCQ